MADNDSDFDYPAHWRWTEDLLERARKEGLPEDAAENIRKELDETFQVVRDAYRENKLGPIFGTLTTRIAQLMIQVAHIRWQLGNR